MWNLCANGAQILRAADCKPIVGNPFRGFRQTQKSLTLRRQAFLYAENRFPGDESQRGLVVIHILLVQSTSQFSSPSRRQSLPRNNPRFAPAFRTMFVALENAKTSLFLALVRAEDERHPTSGKRGCDAGNCIWVTSKRGSMTSACFVCRKEQCCFKTALFRTLLTLFFCSGIMYL